MRYFLLIISVGILNGLNAQVIDLYILTMAKISLGQTDSALIYIDSAISRDPARADYYLTRGDIYYTKGILQKALPDYQRADKIEEGTGFYGQAKYYAAIGNTVKSIEYLKKHLESKYKLSQSEIKMDPAFSGIENTREWKTLWQQEWYSKLDYLLSDAALMMENKEYTDAVNQLSRYLKEHEKRHEAYALRGKAYYEMKSYKNALSDLNSAIEITRRNAGYFKLRALIQVQLAQYNDAVSDYTSSLALNPADIETFMLRAEALRLAARFDESLSDITLYMQYMGSRETALFMAAKAMYDKGDYMKSLTYINKILEKNKNKAEYFLFRGHAYFKSNMAKYAVKDYGMALDIDNNLTEAWVYKGRARLATGDKNGACHDWQIAVQKGSPEAVQLLQDNCLK